MVQCSVWTVPFYDSKTKMKKTKLKTWFQIWWHEVVVEMGNLSSFLLKSNNGFCGFPNRHHRLQTWRRIFVGHSLGFHFSSKYDDYGNSWLHPPHWRVWPPLRSGCRFYVAIERNASAGVALLSGRRYVLWWRRKSSVRFFHPPPEEGTKIIAADFAAQVM